MSTEELQKQFVSAKGITLNLIPVSQFKLDALRQSMEEIPVPTYTMNVVGKDVEYPMDEKIAKNKGRLEEWNEYIEKKNKQAAAQAKKQSELIIYDGVRVEVPDENSEWQKMSERQGIKVPTDIVERKLHYVYTECLVGGDDFAGLISQIMSISQIDQEVVNQIKNSFRVKTKRDTNKGSGKEKPKLADEQSDV